MLVHGDERPEHSGSWFPPGTLEQSGRLGRLQVSCGGAAGRRLLLAAVPSWYAIVAVMHWSAVCDGPGVPRGEDQVRHV